MVTGVDGTFLDVAFLNVAETAGEHDGLVVAPQLRRGVLRVEG